MSYIKAMRHHSNPRKWKMTPARKRGNQLIFGVPATTTTKGRVDMRISELDDIEKEVLLGMVVQRARADLNDGRPLTEMRRKRPEREYCPNCIASLTETDHEAERCTQCGYGLAATNLTESEDEDDNKTDN